MSAPSTSLLNFNSRAWTRKILKNYWFVFVVSVVVECVSMMLSKTNHETFALRYILLPSGLLLIIMVALELYIRRVRRYQDYAVIIAAHFIATVIVITHSTVSSTTSIYMLPILISSFYFQPRMVVFTCCMSLISIALIYSFNVDYRTWTTPIGLVSICAIVIAGCVIAIEVMKRGMEVVNHLRDSMKTNEQLRVENIVMERLAKVDGLTEAYNHKTFHEHLSELISRSELFHGSIYLLLADIDNFKYVNDTYGHHVGDIILRQVAETIQTQLSPNDFLARYGGEEFAVIMVGKTCDEAHAVAEQIRFAVASQVHPEVDNQPVTVSIGGGKFESGKGKDSLFQETDAALYEAKRAGKDRVCFV